MHYIPLGKRFTQLSKTYLGMVATELQHLDIERYYYVLFVLHQAEKPINQKDLACLVYSDRPHLVRIVDYLQSHNCLLRTSNPDDRREQYITLTEKGKEIALEVERAYKKVDSFFLADTKEEAVHDFLNQLQQIAEISETTPKHYVTFNFKTHKK